MVFAVMAAGLFVLAPAAEGAARPRVMVLPIRAQGAVGPEVAAALTDALLVQAGRQDAYAVSGLKEVETTLGHEQLKQVAACETESCAVQIAGALNVDQLVFGTITPLGDELILNLVRVDARSAAVTRRTLQRCPASRPTQFLDLMPQVSADLFDLPRPVDATSPAPMASPATTAPEASAGPPSSSPPPVASVPRAPPRGEDEPVDDGNPGLANAGRALLWTGLGGLALGVLLLPPPVLGGCGSLILALALGGSVGGGTTGGESSGLGPVMLALSAGSLLLLIVDVGLLLGSSGVAVMGAFMRKLGAPSTVPAVDATSADGTQQVRVTRTGRVTQQRTGFAGRAAAAAEPGVPFCRTAVDCSGNGFCQDRGDGLKVCMQIHGGGHGDYCHTANDCAGGGFCRPQGDGTQVCMMMNGGARGAACATALDCADGMFCKDRGDGLLMCM